MSYETKRRNRIKYQKTFDAGGNGDLEFAFRGPKGKKGIIYDYGIEGVTETFTVGEGSIAIGSTADADAYGEEFPTSGLAAEDAASVRNTYVVEKHSTTQTDLRDFIVGEIPADGKALMTVVDTTLDGIGTFWCIVEWED